MYAELVVAKPQSMVVMKNRANASAPSPVFWVASIGMIGGFSFARLRFGPVVATSAGRVGAAGVLGGAVDGTVRVLSGALVGGGVLGESAVLVVHPATHSSANAPIAAFARTHT